MTWAESVFPSNRPEPIETDFEGQLFETVTCDTVSLSQTSWQTRGLLVSVELVLQGRDDIVLFVVDVRWRLAGRVPPPLGVVPPHGVSPLDFPSCVACVSVVSGSLGCQGLSFFPGLVFSSPSFCASRLLLPVFLSPVDEMETVSG